MPKYAPPKNTSMAKTEYPKRWNSTPKEDHDLPSEETAPVSPDESATECLVFRLNWMMEMKTPDRREMQTSNESERLA